MVFCDIILDNSTRIKHAALYCTVHGMMTCGQSEGLRVIDAGILHMAYFKLAYIDSPGITVIGVNVG